jgi:hypothetical protein
MRRISIGRWAFAAMNEASFIHLVAYQLNASL